MAERLVLIGEFGRAQGVRGEVRLRSYAQDPLAIRAYSPLLGEEGRCFALAALRPVSGSPGMLVATVDGVTTREQAEALARVPLYVPRARLPAPAEDEFYMADLIGLRVEARDERTLGVVVAVHDFGAGDIIEVAPSEGGKTALLPFTKAMVPAVDVAAGRIVVAADTLFGDTPNGP